MIQLVMTLMALLCAQGNAESHRPTNQLQRLPGVWNAVLWNTSSLTGHMDHDPILERLFKQLYSDYVTDAIVNKVPLLGAVLDPMWLWPIEDVIEKDLFRSDFKVCNMHMHNFKNSSLVDVQVFRNPDLSAIAARFIFRFPILWITGYYRLYRSLLMGFIPVKSRKGDFMIDIKDVTVGAVIAFKNNEIVMSEYDVGIHWQDITIKFDNIAGRFSTLADLTLNQLGLGKSIVDQERHAILEEMRLYSQALLRCVINNPAEGIELCMRDWWATQGWPWPWKYPVCEQDID